MSYDSFSMKNDFQGADTIDVRDVIARVEELREQQTDRFVAGFNMPGYMPDSDPAEFDDADDALEYIKEEMRRAVDDEELSEEDGAAIDTIKADENGEFGLTVGKYNYWISKDGVMGLDDDEKKELSTLEELLSDLCGYGGDEQWEGDWYPVTLINEDHFEAAMDEMLEDIGDLPKNLPSYLTITVDYDALKQDYSTVEFEGNTYYYR